MERWYWFGNCHQQPDLTELFFSGKAKDVREAKAICRGCPVKADCFLEGVYHDGIWAGLTACQRENLLALWGFPKGPELRDRCYRWFLRPGQTSLISSPSNIYTTKSVVPRLTATLSPVKVVSLRLELCTLAPLKASGS